MMPPKPKSRAQARRPAPVAGGTRARAGRLGLLLALMSVLSAHPASECPQAPANSPSPPSPSAQPIAVEVKVVAVLATVRDKHGEIVRDLARDDFQLEEDGRPQTIRYFARETDLPLTLGLLVDTSLSQRRVLGQERSASTAFLDEVLRVDKDQAFLIHFDREVELLQDLTSSRQKLLAALDLLQTPERSGNEGADSSGGRSGPDSGGGRQGRGGHGGGTLLYDAIYLASKEVMSKQLGRKALVVLSDGVDRGSKETLANAVEAAQRADTLVYSILFADQPGYGGGGYGHHGMGGRGGGMGGPMGRPGGGSRYPGEARPDGKKILEQLSRATGGRFFEVSSKHPIEDTYKQIQDELRNQYSLGYTPSPPDAEPGYHKITLTTSRKNLVVDARDGYYSGR